MPQTYDVIVAGVGAMGSAACYHLAKSGKRVLGLDRFSPPHTFGSSHGFTRIIREAYFEHPIYVPLVQRAYDLWAALEVEAGFRIFHQTGGLMIGRPEGAVFSGAKQSAEQHQLKHQILPAHAVSQRFPAFHLSEFMSAVWEPRAGFLLPEKCIEAHLSLAQSFGTQFGFNEPVIGWTPTPRGVQVQTSKGTYETEHLILSSGAWMSPLVSELKLPLNVNRQVLFWFEAKRNPALFHPDRCPVYIWEYEPGLYFYGFPDIGSGIKVARHNETPGINPDHVNREVTPHEVEKMRSLLGRFLPDAEGKLKSTAVCLYTNTPDGHFILDTHPEHSQVILASPCSGHGFKFSSAIGELLSDWAQGKPQRFDLSLFKRERFHKS